MMSQARRPLRRQHPGWKGRSQALSQSCWQEVLVPPHVGLSKEQLTAGQWAPTEQESRERNRQKPVLYNLISEVTSDIIISAIFYTWYLVTWGDYTKVWIPGLLETSQGCTNLAYAGSTRAAEEHLSHQLQNSKLVNGLPRWHSDKCQCRRCGFDLWVRKKPLRRKWQYTPIFLPGKFHGQRSLVDHNLWGHKKSDMTEWVSTKFANNKGFKHISWR